MANADSSTGSAGPATSVSAARPIATCGKASVAGRPRPAGRPIARAAATIESTHVAAAAMPISVIAALAGPRRHRYHDPVASSGIFEAVLLVLVAAELVPAAPALLIPIRFDQATAFDTVAGGQRLAITAKQPSRFGMINPNPCRPEYGGEERLSVPRRNVDNQM